MTSTTSALCFLLHLWFSFYSLLFRWFGFFCPYPSSSEFSQVNSSKLDNIVSSWLCARYFSHLDLLPQLSMELLGQLYSACTLCTILTTWSSDSTMMNTYGRLWLSTWIFWTFSFYCYVFWDDGEIDTHTHVHFKKLYRFLKNIWCGILKSLESTLKNIQVPARCLTMLMAKCLTHE